MEKSKFFAYYWHVDEKEKSTTTIRIYGLDEKNRNTCVIINDFTPYVYLELPDNIDWESKIALQKIVIEKIKERLRINQPTNVDFRMKKKLYYAQLGKDGEIKKFPFFRFRFPSLEGVKSLTYSASRPLIIPGVGEIKYKVHESNASPVLQLTSQQKIPTAGWITFFGKKKLDNEKITHCDSEYVVSWKQLFEDKENTSVARPLIMGYDIEVNSSNPKAMPKADKMEDKIFQISCVFSRQGESKSDSYLLTLGEVDIDKLDPNTNVRTFKTEYALLKGFTDIIQEKQPNVVVGYNIFTFDIPYMIRRAQILLCTSHFDQQSMVKEAHCNEKTVKWSSSAYKNQSFQFLETEGRLFVDLLPIVRRDYKMSNYKLKTISSYFLKDMTKDPLDAEGIFKCYRIGMKGGEKGRKAMSLVGKYCVKDSLLVVQLFEVLTTWIALCEMSKVTNVPIFLLYTQGQQLKVFSQIYRKCTNENIVVQRDGYVTKKDDYYVGATVFDPKPGVYDRVIPLDFNSLYPTTIIAYNICWSTLVTDDSIPDSMCHVMKWSDHIGCPCDPTVVRINELNKIIQKYEEKAKAIRVERDKNKKNKEFYNKQIESLKEESKIYREERVNLKKKKAKHTICAERNYRWLKAPMGVLPEVLTHLLDSRKNTKNEMKKVKASIKDAKTEEEKKHLETYCDVLDQRQLALKVSANSCYGATGVRAGYLPCMPVAMCTTFKGRKAIERTAHEVQTNFKGVLVYGDSVSADTPILIKYPNDSIDLKRIDNLGDKWIEYEEFKSEDKTLRDKEQSLIDCSVWTNGKWSQIKRVIRHKTQKQMYRILTHTGCIDVTEDHSLLNKNCEQIKPTDVKVGDELLHSFPTEWYEFDVNILMQDNNNNGIRNDELNYITACEWGSNSDDESLFVKGGIPYAILNTTRLNTYAFFSKLIKKKSMSKNVRFESTNKLFLQGVYVLAKRMGYQPIIDENGISIYAEKIPDNVKDRINKIIELGICDDYVYDIETDEGIFHAGIGELVVKNTDSNYITFPHLKTAPECWDYAIYVADEISKLFPKPMKLAFEEKIYWRYMLLTKKRYMSLVCERDGVVSEKLNSKGVLMQRRDNCSFIRNIYESVVMSIFNKKSTNEILDSVLDSINKLFTRSYEFSDFVVTKSVGDTGGLVLTSEFLEEEKKNIYKVGDYKVKPLPSDLEEKKRVLESKECSDEAEYYLSQLPAQVQLAEKMRERGQLVAPGTRLEYVITMFGGHLAKQSVKTESYEYFIKHSSVLTLDYLYYLKQLSNPLDQILKILDEKEGEFTNLQYKYRLHKYRVIEQIKSLFIPKIIIDDTKEKPVVSKKPKFRFEIPEKYIWRGEDLSDPVNIEDVLLNVVHSEDVDPFAIGFILKNHNISLKTAFTAISDAEIHIDEEQFVELVKIILSKTNKTDAIYWAKYVDEEIDAWRGVENTYHLYEIVKNLN